MEPTQKKPTKIVSFYSIEKDAQDIALDNGYCSIRGQGAFFSELIYDYHRRKTHKLTHAEIVAELRRLVDLLGQQDAP